MCANQLGSLPQAWPLSIKIIHTSNELTHFSLSCAQNLKWQDLLLLPVPGNCLRVDDTRGSAFRKDLEQCAHYVGQGQGGGGG